MTPSDDKILTRVRQILVDALSVAPADVVPEARIVDDLCAESIDLLDLRFRLEREFGIRITAEDLAEAFRGATDAAEFRRMFTVGALCSYVARRMDPASG
jgi:acyl carrier protein